MYETSAVAAPANPWLSIWTQPRDTVRYLVATDPDRHVLQLAMAGGVAQSLAQAMESGVGDKVDLAVILLMSLVIGSVFGLLMLYLGSALLHWTGRWIGGRATREQLRTAVGWSNVPVVVLLFAAGPLLGIAGRVPFMSEQTLVAGGVGLPAAAATGVFGIAMVVLTVWAFVILLKGVGEVQGFSAWKAWGNVLFAGAAVLLPIVALGVLAAILIPGSA